MWPALRRLAWWRVLVAVVSVVIGAVLARVAFRQPDDDTKNLLSNIAAGFLSLPFVAIATWAMTPALRAGPRDPLDELESRIRARAKLTGVDGVREDADIAAELVRMIDDRYGKLLRRYTNAAILRDDARLTALNTETAAFVAGQDLLPRLQARRAALRAAAGGLGPSLAAAVTNVVTAIDAYLAHVGGLATATPPPLAAVLRLGQDLEARRNAVDADTVADTAAQSLAAGDYTRSALVRDCAAQLQHAG